MKIFRQGDLVFTRISDATVINGKKEKSFVLARGEHTNHCHTLTKEAIIERLTDNSIVFEVNQITPLTHEEHKTIEIPPGKYKMHFERSYDPFLKQIRQTLD